MMRDNGMRVIKLNKVANAACKGPDIWIALHGLCQGCRVVLSDQ